MRFNYQQDYYYKLSVRLFHEIALIAHRNKIEYLKNNWQETLRSASSFYRIDVPLLIYSFLTFILLYT